ncbi:pancreatic lipase-related protein 2-like [Epargyreus clarus]|uniref:pancreatic lipase-related protein 2-like n=1 Tax=Epargyreus clarus TaxID=520877 RepID=UPI003C2FF007
MGSVFGFLFLIAVCVAQREVSIPLSADSFRQILRTAMPVPDGRSATASDIRIIYYGTNITQPSTYRVGSIKRLLSNPNFDVRKPTTFYIHGYVELWNDFSVETVVRAYLKRGGYNILVLDWANFGFGNYIGAGLSVQTVGMETGKALLKLLKGGLSLQGLHIVGHSMGVNVAAIIARYLKSKGVKVPRLTGLDPAYPGFYPALLAVPVSPEDAGFVDIMHTDGGGFGAPASTGHADFWPNHGTAKQPGCLPLTVPLTAEDFCSHWRSWRFWAEAVEGGKFLARRCSDYDTFLRGRCRNAPLVIMGIETDTTLRGNFYLRTAAQEPFALGERGAE